MKIRVLLVDDEKDFIDVLAERLEARDFTTAKAYSGDEAMGRHQSLIVKKGDSISGILRMSDVFKGICDKVKSCKI
jgi:hypothetical protein